MFSRIILFVATLIILFDSIHSSTSISSQKRWISNDKNIRKISRMLLQCPNLNLQKDTVIGWCINGQQIYDSQLRRATITNDSSLHLSIMYENDRISCGDINLCGCSSFTELQCDNKVYTFVFNFSYYEENELYCSKNGVPRREYTVAGFETIICDCYYGYFGEFCEFESKSRHWMLIFFWFIIASVLASLLLALLRQKFQTRYRPPHKKLRFVDILNDDLKE